MTSSRTSESPWPSPRGCSPPTTWPQALVLANNLQHTHTYHRESDFDGTSSEEQGERGTSQGGDRRSRAVRRDPRHRRAIARRPQPSRRPAAITGTHRFSGHRGLPYACDACELPFLGRLRCMRQDGPWLSAGALVPSVGRERAYTAMLFSRTFRATRSPSSRVQRTSLRRPSRVRRHHPLAFLCAHTRAARLRPTHGLPLLRPRSW